MIKSKIAVNMYIKVIVFFHYVKEVFEGKYSIHQFIVLLERLNYFLGKMKNNKYALVDNTIKVDLYVPGFPSKAFFTACDKFNPKQRNLPCTTVLISITSACKFKCEHCYQRLDKGKDVDIEVLVDVVKKMQDMGIAFFNIEGGDPFIMYDRLKRVCEVIDDRSVIFINSTGDDVTEERLVELKSMNVKAIMFSVHTTNPRKLNKFMGKEDAFDTMIRGIDLCNKVGVGVAINTCLKREDFYNGTFEDIMEFAREKNASIVQIIKPKTAGAWLNNKEIEYDNSEIDKIKEKIQKYNLDKKYRDYPMISAQIIEEDKNHFGCSAGGTDRFYINAKGDLQPCEFLNISFGNIMDDSFADIYENMKKEFMNPCESWLCEKYSGDILKMYVDNSLDTLPLSKSMSKQIYSKWDRGEETELYKRIKEIK